ncbi:MAG: D-glycerate dehydrogenase [Acidobacteria bacterium]|nr:D-glycerate dehydrogenase [Acidobacteriota bacterium]
MELDVFVTQPIPQPGLDLLAGAHPHFRINPEERVLGRAQLLEGVRGAAGILALLTDRIDAEVLDAAGPQLRIVANMAVGFDNIDLRAASARGVMVTNTPGVLTDATADLAWALLFAAARRIPEAERFLRAGRFRYWGPLLFLGADVAGRTLGVVGAGRIGSAVARRARGFDMKVLYCNRSPRPGLESELGARKVPLEELLAEADFVSLHLPLTPETRHLIDARALALMKPTACLINTGRGPLVDEAALVEALAAGRPAGAALDVFEREPEVHPGLLARDDVVLTPHIGSATVSARARMAEMAAENLLAGLRGERPPNLVGGDAREKKRPRE